MSSEAGITSFVYNKQNRLITNASPVGPLVYAYDENGNLTNMVSSTPAGISIGYQYDALKMNFTRQPMQWPCQRKLLWRWDSFSVTNTSQNEAKITYVRLNTQTPCPPRSAVPVNQGSILPWPPMAA